MRVTFLLPDRATGGGGRAVVRFANELIGRGHSVRLFMKRRRSGIRQTLSQALLQRLYGAQDWLHQYKGESRTYTSLQPGDFQSGELVVSMDAETVFDAASVSASGCIPVHHSHGAEYEGWQRMIEAWEAPSPKLAVSTHMSRLIKRETGREVFAVVPDGVDPGEYHPSVPEAGRNAVGASFRWRYSKDPGCMIRVFQALHHELPGLPLVCFGNGRKPQPFEGVRYSRYPSVEEARGMYSRCKVWFHTSIEEGFGLPVLEAMACGCVVVSTESGGPQDIIQDGHNGFLVGIGNYGAIVQRITRVLADDALRAEMAGAAMETARRFTWEAAGLALERALEGILAERGAGRGEAR